MKKAKKKYDFTDMLTKVYTHLRDNPEDLKRVQKYYDYIIADEIQDFTPIMMSILQLFVSDGTPLMCIGDEDQGIYNFRGADALCADQRDSSSLVFIKCGSPLILKVVIYYEKTGCIMYHGRLRNQPRCKGKCN